MAIPVACEYCGRRHRVRDEFAGEELPCKECGEYFVVPSSSRRFSPRTADERQPKNRSKSRSSGPPAWVLPLVFGVAVLFGGGILVWLMALGYNGIAKAGSELFPVAEVPLPNFPQELPPPIRTLPSGAQIHFVDLKTVPGNGNDPGCRMALRIYLPPGDHAPGSLGCVLVAPAGSNLLRGNPMDPDDYHDETVPYVQAGFAVVFYSIDGELFDPDNASDALFAKAYREFKAAHAGVVNGRNALEFVRAKIPAVDPERIYCAGHSSAGVLSLLLAEHEPRINGCIAYAPATDVELRLQDVADHPGVRKLLPDIRTFLKQSSPKTHAAHLECPVFLFHAEDDSNEPITTTRAFAKQLEDEGKTFLFETTPTGDHYNSMIRTGIPLAVKWLKQLPTEQGKTYPEPSAPQPIADNDPPRQPPPGFQVPNFEPPPIQTPPIQPPRMPRPGGTGRVMVFAVQSYSGPGDATDTARRVLRRYPWCVADTVQVDLDSNQIIIEVRGRLINSGPVKSGLEQAGFQLGSVTVRSQ